MSKEEFLQKIKHLPSNIIKNCTIIDNTIERKKALHISTIKQKSFTPWVSHRGMIEEPNTILRVYAALTLADCIFGYSTTLDDIFTNSIFIKNTRKTFKGGYYIHYIDFDYGLIPNTKLVPDANAFTEVWLITYNKETVSYKTTNIDELMLTQLTISKYNKTNVEYTEEFLVNCTQHLPLDRDIVLAPGCYKFIYNRRYEEKVTIQSVISHTPISKSEYENKKSNIAAFEHLKCSYLNW